MGTVHDIQTGGELSGYNLVRLSTNKGQDKTPEEKLASCPSSEPKAVRQAWDDLYNLIPSKCRADRHFVLALSRMWAEYDMLSCKPFEDRTKVETSRLNQLETKVRTFLSEARCTPKSRLVDQIKKNPDKGSISDMAERKMNEVIGSVGAM